VSLVADLRFAWPRRLSLRAAGAALLALPAALAVIGITGAGGNDAVVTLASYATPLAFGLGAALCLARARAFEHERAAWTWLGVACCCWTAANLYYALVLAPSPAPLPSPLDLGYITFPIAVCAGLLARARAQVPKVPVDVVLDGLVAALGTAAVAAAVIFNLGHADPASLPALITTCIYPIEDVALLGVLAGVAALSGWRLGRGWAYVAAAIGAITVADALTFGHVLSGSDTGGAWTNFGWTLGIALMGLGAWQHAPERRLAAPARQRELVLPLVFASLALGVVTLDHVLDLTAAASVLAGAALAVSGVRLARSFREIRALADSRRLALTDELTGLPNRRALLADLDAACANGGEHMLALFDLDGFKRYNDLHGHPQGDVLLCTLAQRLRRVIAPRGRAYRLGGDEFCVLAPADARMHDTVAAAAGALQDAGPFWSVMSSFGVVELPHEARSTAYALQIADRRMYAQKERRPAAARQQAGDVLLSALGEQQPSLHSHAADVTELARGVARALGMSVDEIEDVARAAELHDVGKLAIPSEILDKPGPLDEAEWAVMRRHTEIGERMLRAAPALAPIAPLVRSSHERFDGAGYPDGLAGEAIPLGARIVAVCDAFDAMVTDRPYRDGMPREAAVEELRRCAGTQFDPRVVRAFLAVLEPAGAPAQQPVRV
jgi:diguanylate cyclase (GGDEF)-like protein